MTKKHHTVSSHPETNDMVTFTSGEIQPMKEFYWNLFTKEAFKRIQKRLKGTVSVLKKFTTDKDPFVPSSFTC